MRGRAARRVAAVVLVAAGALGGCGVPTDDDARRIPDRDVPFDLLDPARPTSPTTPTTSVP